MERVFAWIALALMAGLVLARPATAKTDRFYLDQHVASAGNVVRLDATSPDNAGERPRPFARDFTYVLTRVSDGKRLWSHKQGVGEPSPIRAFVHDDGWVVVWNARHELMVLDKDTGAVKARDSILDQFPEAEAQQYVHQSTAGPIWSSGSSWTFVTVEDRTLFVITTGWGRRLVMDLAKGEYVRLGGAAGAQLEESVLAAARETLRVAVEDLEALCGARRVVEGKPVEPPVSAGEVSAALAMLLRAEDRRVVLHLLELEKCTYVGSSGGWWDIDGKYEGGINPFQQREFTLRRVAQLGLRRLGETPAAPSGVQISGGHAIGVNLPAPRAERVDLLRPGMKPREILETIGHPDQLRFGRRGTWEYDIDAEEPFTLVIHFDADHLQVDRTERVPPKWMGKERWDDVFGLN
ncbi:MAG: hypothetical protein RIE77_08740 [Phycisphaerales bacterium]|jgi:hypothetical protein